MPHGCSGNLHEQLCLLYLRKLSVVIAEETREYLVEVSVCFNDFQGNHRSVPPVWDPLHIILFAYAGAGNQDSRAWGVGLGTNIER